jgi:hypothetical protein
MTSNCIAFYIFKVCVLPNYSVKCCLTDMLELILARKVASLMHISTNYLDLRNSALNIVGIAIKLLFKYIRFQWLLCYNNTLNCTPPSTYLCCVIFIFLANSRTFPGSRCDRRYLSTNTFNFPSIPKGREVHLIFSSKYL